MADEAFLIAELSLQGFACSQILAILALEAQRKSSPELVRAMSGLLSGMECGQLCGCVSGGCCVLGLYAGRSSADEPESDHLPHMLRAFVGWFDEEYGARYGAATCAAITENDASLRLARCPEIVLASFQRLRAILDEHGYDWEGEGVRTAE